MSAMRATGMKLRAGSRRFASAGTAEAVDRVAVAVHAAVAEAAAAARQTDLPQHGCQRRGHPVGSARHARRAAARRRRRSWCGRRPCAGEATDRIRVDLADRRRPVGGLGLAVGLAHHIGAERLEAGGVAREIGFVCRSSVISVCAMPSIMATSVAGRARSIPRSGSPQCRP